MTLKTLAAAACISFAGATATIAAPVPVDFNFSFSDGTDTITGLIEGLVSEGSNQAASAITITGVLDTYKLDVFDLFVNNFTVNNGIFDSESSEFAFSLTQLGMDGSGELFGAFFIPSVTAPFFLQERRFGENIDVLFSATAGIFTPVAAVPLPAGGLLLLTGLGGVAALKRRKKRAA